MAIQGHLIKELTLALVILLALLLCCFSRGSTGVGEVRVGDNAGKRSKESSETLNASQPLRLTTTVVGKQYCKRDGEDYGTLTLRLRARFTNVSPTRVILFKGDNLVYAEMISHSEEDAVKGAYESYREFHWVFPTSEPPKRELETAKPTKQFAVLPPNAYFDTHVRVPVTIALETKRRISAETERTVPDEFGGIPPGPYVLQITVSTWLGSSELASSLRKRWEGIGLFWLDNITSQPMKFVVDDKQSSTQCG